MPNRFVKVKLLYAAQIFDLGSRAYLAPFHLHSNYCSVAHYRTDEWPVLHQPSAHPAADKKNSLCTLLN